MVLFAWVVTGAQCGGLMEMVGDWYCVCFSGHQCLVADISWSVYLYIFVQLIQL